VRKLYLNEIPEPASVSSQPIIVDQTNLKFQEQQWKTWLQ